MVLTDAPKDATHAHVSNKGRHTGGHYVYHVTYFKQVNGIWFIYSSDTDNEYPGWRQATRFDFVTILCCLIKL